jgi:hypothetical protein
MSNFSDYAESGLINFLLRANTNSFARPSAIAIALCSNAPTESQTGATIPELANTGAYARYAVTQDNSNWTEVSQVSNSGFTENAAEFLFATANANWGHVSGYAIVDSATHGAGNVLMLGTFPTPRDVKNGDAVVIRAGSLDIYLG